MISHNGNLWSACFFFTMLSIETPVFSIWHQVELINFHYSILRISRLFSICILLFRGNRFFLGSRCSVFPNFMHPPPQWFSSSFLKSNSRSIEATLPVPLFPGLLGTQIFNSTYCRHRTKGFGVL